MFYVEEKQPNGKWRRCRYTAYPTQEKAQEMADMLEEHGSGIAFRVVEA